MPLEAYRLEGNKEPWVPQKTIYLNLRARECHITNDVHVSGLEDERLSLLYYQNLMNLLFERFNL